MMTEPRGLRQLELRSETGLQIKTKSLREEMSTKRKLNQYEKDFNIQVSRIASQEKQLRNSMKAYSDKMATVSRSTRARQAFVLPEGPTEVDDSPLLVRARHISRQKPLAKLKGEKERLDMLRDHLSRSFDGVQEKITPRDGRRDDRLRRSLPNMKLESLPKNKEDYQMKLVSASDLFDIVDNPNSIHGSHVRRGNVRLEPLDGRSKPVDPKDIVIDSEKKPLAKAGNVKYTIIRTKRGHSKTEQVVVEISKPTKIPALLNSGLRPEDFGIKTRNSKQVEENEKGRLIRVLERGNDSEYNTSDTDEQLSTRRVQSTAVPNPVENTSDNKNSNTDEDRNVPKEAVRFSPDEFDKQLRAAISKSKKAKRMKMRAPNLGAIPEDISESEDEDDAEARDHDNSAYESHRKIPRRSSPSDGTFSSISLQPMLAAIPELPSSHVIDSGVHKSLNAIKVMRKTGSKEELLKHQQDSTRNVSMATQHFDGQMLMKESKKTRARRNMRSGNNKMMKLKFLKDIS